MKLNRKLRNMRKEMKKTSSSARKMSLMVQTSLLRMQQMWKSLMYTMQKVRAVALKLFTALVAFNAISFGAFALMEREMVNVQTMMDGTAEETEHMRDRMTDALMDISNQMGESAKELSKGLYKVLSLGVEEDAAIPVVQQLEKAAKAGKATIEETANAAISTVNALGLEIDDLNSVLNVQFETIREGNTTYSEMARALQNVLPSAMRVGAEMDELYGSMAFLTKVSMEPRRAATALSRTFETLSQKSGNLAYKLENTFAEIEDIQLYNAHGQMKGFYEIMKQISQQTETMSTQRLQQVWKTMGLSKRAARGMVPIIQRFDMFEDIIKKVGKASEEEAGTMEEAFSKIEGSATFQLKQLIESVKNTFATLGKIMKPTIMPVIESFTQWFQVIQDVMKANEDLVVNIMKSVGNILKSTIILSSVGTFLLGLLNPIQALITAVGLLAVAWYINFNGIRDRAEKFVKTINKLDIFGMIDKFKNLDILTKLSAGIFSVTFGWMIAKTLTQLAVSWLIKNMVGAMAGAGGGIGAANFMLSLGRVAIEPIIYYASWVWAVGKTIVASLLGFLTGLATTGWAIKGGMMAMNGLNAVASFAISAISWTWAAGISLASSLYAYIQTSLGTILAGGSQLLGSLGVGLAIGAGLSIALDPEIDGLASWWEAFKDGMEAMGDKALWDKLYNDTKTHWTNVAKDFWELFVDAGHEVLSNLNPLNWFGGKQKANNFYEKTEFTQDTTIGNAPKSNMGKFWEWFTTDINAENNYDGGIVPGGNSNKDNMLSMVASGEAIVPNYVMSGGKPAIMNWFKEQGIPGFYDGKEPGPVRDSWEKSTPDNAQVSVPTSREMIINVDIPQTAIRSTLEDMNSLLSSTDGTLGSLVEAFGELGSQFMSSMLEGAEDKENANNIRSMLNIFNVVKDKIASGIENRKSNLQEQIDKLKRLQKSYNEGTVTNQESLDALQQTVKSSLGRGDTAQEMMNKLGMDMMDKFITQLSNQMKNTFEKEVSGLYESILSNQTITDLTAPPERDKKSTFSSPAEMFLNQKPGQGLGIPGVDGSGTPLAPNLETNVNEGKSVERIKKKYDEMGEKILEKAEIMNKAGVISDAKLKEIQRKYGDLKMSVTNGLLGIADGLSQFANQLQNLGIGGSGLNELTSAVGSISSGVDMMKSLTDVSGSGLAGQLSKFGQQGSGMLSNLAGSAGGALGSLASFAGPAGAAIGAVSAFKSWNDKQNKQAQKEWEEQQKRDEKRLQEMKAIKENTAETSNNITRAVSENPTTANIGQGQEALTKHINLLKKAGTTISDAAFVIKEDDLWDDDKETFKSEALDMFHELDVGMENMGLTKEMETRTRGSEDQYEYQVQVGYEETVGDLDFKQLNQLQDKFESLTDPQIKDYYHELADTMDMAWAGGGELKSGSDNTKQMREQLDSYLETVKQLTQAKNNLPKESRLESFQGVDYLSQEEAIKKYKKQLTETYEKAELDIEKYKDKINSTAKAMAKSTDKQVTVMREVRGTFIKNFEAGERKIESFAAGLKGYFQKMKSNVNSMIYDIEFSELNAKFEAFFGNFSEELSEYEGDNPLLFAQQMLGGEGSSEIDAQSGQIGVQLDSLFKDMKEFESKQKNMDSIFTIMREQAKEAGLSDDIIDKMLPKTEASKKAKELANKIEGAVSGALKSAFDEMGNFNYLDMTQSLGQSVYDSVKQSMIDAFKDSEVYKQKLQEFFQEDQFQENISGMSMREVGQYMEETLKGLDQELRRAGMDRTASQVQTEVQDTSQGGTSDYYGGADTSGKGADITNHNYYFAPDIENSYGDTKEELYEDFIAYKEEIEKTQA